MTGDSPVTGIYTNKIDLIDNKTGMYTLVVRVFSERFGGFSVF